MVHAFLLVPLAGAIGSGTSLDEYSLASMPATTSSYELTALEPHAAPRLPQSRRNEGWFLELGGGFVTTTDSDGPGEEVDFDEGLGVFLGVGKRFAGQPDAFGFDLMLEGIYTDQDASQSGSLQAVNDVTVAGVLVSGLGDFALTERFSVFGGAGLGVSWLDVGTTSDAFNDFDSDEGALLTWQARLGGRLRFSPDTSAFLGYRFLNIDDAEIDDDLGGASFDLATEQHILEIGFRFGPAGS